MTTFRPQGQRRGVTILEVLFSIGIILIGILGISIIINVAGFRAQQGVRARTSASLAEQAMSEIDLRGWKRPDTLVVVSGGSFASLQQVVNNPATFAAIFRNRIPSFCIDPYFIAKNINSGVVPPLATRFPYVNTDPATAALRIDTPLVTLPGAAIPFLPAGAVSTPLVGPQIPLPLPTSNPFSMPRISVRAAPGGSVFPMNLVMAERITTDQNALAFDLPKDRTLGPVQKWGPITLPPTPPLRRQTDGTLSWIATVSPRFNRNKVVSDQFALSVVILRARVPTLQLGGGLNQTTERLVLANQFLGNGLGGGTLQLITRNTLRSANDLALRRSQWIMLSGMLRDANGTLTPMHAWYKVMSVDDTPERITTASGVQVWSRWATLQGPDWPIFHPVLNPRGIFVQDIRVTIVDTVEAVREETIRMEGDSLWN